MPLKHLIAYDVTTAKTQRKACKLCRSASSDYQKSVFEIKGDHIETEQLAEQIEEHLNADDQLLIAVIAPGSEIIRIGHNSSLRYHDSGLYWFG
jgi:CRISPR-associated endonuclease Cas2